MTSIKVLAESAELKAIPSTYAYSVNHVANTGYDPDVVPIVDFSLYTTGNADDKAKFMQDLRQACEEWGGFMVVNHDIPVDLIQKVMDASSEFFNLPEEEKKEFEGKLALDPIRCGTGFHGAKKEKAFLWRDYLKAISHPDFHFPHKPKGYSEVAKEYITHTRRVALQLLAAIEENLGFEKSYMTKTLDLEKNFQIFAVNLYPPCPQPELAIGLPPHTDHGLITLLIQNGVGGLQVQKNGKWYNMNSPPNAILINLGDQLEIFTNGKYKSLWHRAVVNNKTTRITLVTPNGPGLHTVVKPDERFVDSETNPAAYMPMEYKEYMEIQQNTGLDRTPPLERVKVKA